MSADSKSCYWLYVNFYVSVLILREKIMAKKLAPELLSKIKANLAKRATKKVARIDFTKCFADPTYQREYKQEQVNAIVLEFDPDAVKMPKLSRRHCGTYAIIDGQHTIGAHLDLGINFGDCEVYSNLSVEREAALFHKANDPKNRRNVVGWANFRAALVAGALMEHRIKEIVESEGLVLGLNNAPHPDFKTPNVLIAIYRQRKEPLFRRLIATLKLCMVQSNRDKHLREDAKRNEFQRGLAKFLASNEYVTPKMLKAAMDKQKVTADSLYNDAVTMAGECRRSRSIDRFFAERLQTLIDKHCKSNTVVVLPKRKARKKAA